MSIGNLHYSLRLNIILLIWCFIDDESQSESEALSSFNVSRATHESSTAKSPIQSPVSVTSETEEESRDGE